MSACNQAVCILDTLDLHRESGEQFPMTASTLMVIPRTLTANVYLSLVMEPVVLPFMNTIEGVICNKIMLALILLL